MCCGAVICFPLLCQAWELLFRSVCRLHLLQVKSLKEHSERVTDLSFDAKAEFLASCSSDGTIAASAQGCMRLCSSRLLWHMMPCTGAPHSLIGARSRSARWLDPTSVAPWRRA